MNEVAAYLAPQPGPLQHALPRDVKKATIIESEGVAGQGDWDDVPDPDDEHRYRDYLRRRLACIIGGPWAEGRYSEEEVEFTPASFYGDDWEELNDYITELAGENSDEQERITNEAAMQANRILTERWPNVEAIAKALIKHGELGRDQLLSLLPRVQDR
jgi:hypothetical protein